MSGVDMSISTALGLPMTTTTTIVITTPVRPPPPKYWTLNTAIKLSRFMLLYNKLGVKLSDDNYTTWSRIVESTLQVIKVFEYCNGKLPIPDNPNDKICWLQADALVQSVLLTNIESELISQLNLNISMVL
jgi:hypothetical protein